jgi:hypothetical protein
MPWVAPLAGVSAKPTGWVRGYLDDLAALGLPPDAQFVRMDGAAEVTFFKTGVPLRQSSGGGLYYPPCQIGRLRNELVEPTPMVDLQRFSCSFSRLAVALLNPSREYISAKSTPFHMPFSIRVWIAMGAGRDVSYHGRAPKSCIFGFVFRTLDVKQCLLTHARLRGKQHQTELVAHCDGPVVATIPESAGFGCTPWQNFAPSKRP